MSINKQFKCDFELIMLFLNGRMSTNTTFCYVEYGISGFPICTGNVIIVNDDSVYISRLNENVLYDFYVTPHCHWGVSNSHKIRKNLVCSAFPPSNITVIGVHALMSRRKYNFKGASWSI